ncbi:MAG: hypothetical protein HYY22_01770 [Thaumarchaeota archaeon]|nr:hypothetical protein [Nitrososphaerota archaeon]
MTSEIVWFVRIMEGIGLSLGGLIAYLSLKAYRKGGGNNFILSALGFILLTVSSIIEGAMYELTKASVFEVHAVRAVILVAALTLIVVSVLKMK